MKTANLRSAFVVCLVFHCLFAVGLHAQQPVEVKVVVVTMFELGEDTGDRAGELQHWIEREGIERVFDFPQGYRDLRLSDDGVLVVCTGVGTARAAAVIMALGMDTRFDLRKAYWVIAGIAGIDPEDGATGSAVWANLTVDGDLAHEIDAREIPADWPTGFIPLRKTRPYQEPRTPASGEAFMLDTLFVDWAYRLTRDVELMDNEAMRQQRAQYASRTGTRMGPRVMKGDVLSASTFWHGRKLSEWANGWIRYFTDGRGNYVTTAMEDSGTMQALTFLTNAGRADITRTLILRTGSNYDQQRDGISAAENLAEIEAAGFPAFVPAVDAAHRVGSIVVRELVRGWSDYRERVPR